MDTNLQQARSQIAALLPSALLEAVNAYNAVLADKSTEPAKVKFRYLALKACAAHIEQLLKIAAQTQSEDPPQNLPALLAAAQEEIESTKR